MSDYVQQNSVLCNFESASPWLVLSPIEQSIKHKIETIGKPLKNWNGIKIYYGIKTGCIEAFIISTEVRDNILKNCKDDDERTRTAELIRPILQGRNIGRYRYNWPNTWLIATFPSKKYDIEDYPSIKAYFLSFGKERLLQEGKTYQVNGEVVKSRKKTNNKWYETQDSIKYWEDFSKPKIFWSDISESVSFVYLDEIMYITNTCYMIANPPRYMIHILNSKLIDWYLRLHAAALGNKAFRCFKIYIENLPLIKVSSEESDRILVLVREKKYAELDNYICALYGLDREEMEIIGL